MTPTLVGILHVAPAVDPTLSSYLARVLVHLLAFGGLALLVRGGFALASAARSASSTDGNGGADR